ncbi:acyltransferase domain-containing protein [Streptomyces sp. NPDC127098]|uniref:acyltransferase domain-containing protein n=1 Tax=Streptomyces sp. NPDC127098 TaxID=3347137 RepID=UPI00366003F5
MSRAPDRGAPSAPPPVVVHMFPGQGDFSVTPLVRAVRTRPVVRAAAAEVFARIDEVSDGYGIPALGPALLGDRPPSGRELAAGPVGTPQVALFGAALTVHRALCAAGAVPERMVAVSFGEIAALTAAGVWSPADGTHIACRLSRYLAHCRGGMTLLAAGESEARRLIDTAGSRRTVVACVNDPDTTVLSGPSLELRQVERCAGDRGVGAAPLRLSFASHHPSLTAEAEGFAAAIRTLTPRPAHTMVYSAVHGGPYGKTDDLHQALADCLTRPARLPRVLARATDAGPALLLETGIGETLTRSARRVLSQREGVRAHSPLADPDFPWDRPRRLLLTDAPRQGAIT